MSLFDLPDCFVELLDICWQVKVLYASVMGNELHAHLVCPQAPLDEIPKEVSVHLNKLSGEYATHIQILGVWLKGLVVAEDLGRACSGHRGDQQRVTQTMLRNLGLQSRPVPSATLRFPTPEIKLQLSLACRRAGKCLIRSIARAHKMPRTQQNRLSRRYLH